jgi:hypothetical protein
MINYKNYPPNWLTEIRPRILKRAYNRCEQCSVPDRALIKRNTSDKFKWVIFDTEELGYVHPNGRPLTYEQRERDYTENEVIVILTIHHIGIPKPDGSAGDPHDKMDCRDDNLIALCQRCHLLQDLPNHIANAKKTRLRKKIEREQEEIARTGQLQLFGGL